jgi:hypothetical protein
MGKFVMSEGLKAIAANNAAKMGTSVTKIADFVQHSITSVLDSIFGEGCVVNVPDKATVESTDGLIGFDVFTTNGRTSKAPYIWCNSTEGPKKLYISQLVRRVTPYEEKNGEYVRAGEAVHSDTDLFNKLTDLRDAGSILEQILGKDLVVKKVIPGKTARYTSGAITGLRDFNLACFEITE